MKTAIAREVKAEKKSNLPQQVQTQVILKEKKEKIKMKKEEGR